MQAPHRGRWRAQARRLAVFTNLRVLRVVTGLTLFTYVALHLCNHALGNISIAAMETGLSAQTWIWQSIPGTAALYTALALHLSLGLWAFYERRHFGWTPTEVLQLVLGLSIPPLLTNHVIVTRLSQALYGTHKGYAQELYSFWVNAPELGVQQATVLLVAWIHGCIGVYLWLRLKRRVIRIMPLLLCAATVLPILALLGFYQTGRTALALAQNPIWRAANLAPAQIGTPDQNARLKSCRNSTLLTGAGLIGLVIFARFVRAWRERRGGTIRISYPDGRIVRMPHGFSVLEASRAGRVPHTGICGGRGRCSTCRVRVITAGIRLPPPAPTEQAVLDRVAAGPGVRLACQLRPQTDIAVVPLLPPALAATLRHRNHLPAAGEERFIVAMVIDMRSSVRLAETRMPFDAVFIVDRFIAALDHAVTRAGGRANSFTGDGLVATFGLASTPEQACHQAIAALVQIGRNVAALNLALADELPEPIRFGVGVHGGTAIVGEIGYAETRIFTAVGDAVNVAARLEAQCRSFGCEAIITEDVCCLSGLMLASLPLHEMTVRGRTAALMARTVPRVQDLADLLQVAPQVLSD